ncbi:MAG: hypothetical protein AAFZ15_06130 [Bacteroidota bacterium]
MATSYQHFLDKFPSLKLPVTLKEEDAHTYSAENQPLPHKLIGEFILPYEEEVDEFTEYVPCFKLSGTKNFDAIVYWKAGLLNYQYVMLTLGKGGKAIDKKVIAGTFSDGQIITRSVARIDDDMSIFIMSGQASRTDEKYNASQSTTIELEILPDGKLIELVE